MRGGRWRPGRTEREVVGGWIGALLFLLIVVTLAYGAALLMPPTT